MHSSPPSPKGPGWGYRSRARSSKATGAPSGQRIACAGRCFALRCHWRAHVRDEGIETSGTGDKAARELWYGVSLVPVPVVLFSELARLSRWTGPIWSQVVRVISIEQVLPCDKAALGNINRWRDFPNIMGRRNFGMSGLRESNRRECQRTRYG